jgi:RNA polymerase sigma-70 factor (ECF subfamily)
MIAGPTTRHLAPSAAPQLGSAFLSTALSIRDFTPGGTDSLGPVVTAGPPAPDPPGDALRHDLPEAGPPGEGPNGGGSDGESDHRVLIDTLVARAVSDDGRARHDLLALIHPLVLKYCRARLGRQESLMGSADDVAQDVCMAVVSALPHYQLKGLSFRAFVYGIAAHKVTDAFRAIGRNRAEPVAELPDAPVTADGPEHRLLAAEMSARLGALLAHLTPRQREVLVLRLAVGLSAEETAQTVRSTPGAVRVTQHRALGRLRRILLGEAASRVVDDPSIADLAPGEVVADPGPGGDVALDAMAAFLDGRVPLQADRRAVPCRRG